MIANKSTTNNHSRGFRRFIRKVVRLVGHPQLRKAYGFLRL
jgi:hypothetical protein